MSGGAPAATDHSVAGAAAPASDALYQSHWAGSAPFTFDVPVTDGRYDVRLHFVETGVAAAGGRVFDVDAEDGQTQVTDLDVYARAGGAGRALVEHLVADVGDGRLTLRFVPRVGDAMVSAIEILPATP